LKVTIVGTGYVGLVSGACFAEVGNDVLCLDLDSSKIRMLEAGEIPIYEPGLLEVVRRNRAAGRLHFTTKSSARCASGQCSDPVGTPPGEDGSADLRHVLARGAGDRPAHDRVPGDRGTSPPCRSALRTRCAGGRGRAPQTRRGHALRGGVEPRIPQGRGGGGGLYAPDRIVVVADDPKAIQIMRALYAPFQRNTTAFS